MTTVDARPADAGAVETFESLDPVSGEPVGRFPVHDEAAVAAAVRRAAPAALWWDRLGFAGRAGRLAEWRRRLTGRMQELAELVHRENGKPVDDALIEIVAMLEHVDWAGRHAEKVLGRRSVRTSVLL
jgi:acyl-CoA reductase-like NAD-dependent aldehyde dehydrogenase